MVNDVAMPLNPLIVPVEKEEFKETLLDVNLSQWSSKEEPFRRVVHIRIDHSA
jgi:hypothetical protein